MEIRRPASKSAGPIHFIILVLRTAAESITPQVLRSHSHSPETSLNSLLRLFESGVVASADRSACRAISKVSNSGKLGACPFFKDGRVAQLAEHLLCKQGVRGSNPLTSTIFSIT